MSERDADFSSAVIEAIASRAGFRCSFPDCDESTIGPGAGAEDIEKKGVAAHIFSASAGPRGPRGTGGLTAEQRSKALNGIWLCEDHGRIVDTDKGKNYPAPVLQAWKALQETRIAREVQKVPIGHGGWIERVVIENSPLIQKGASIVLGKVTLIVGDNFTGKSAVCEWISGSAKGVADLWRWSGSQENQKVQMRIAMFMPDRLEFSTCFYNYQLRSEYQGRRVFDVSHALQVFYVKDGLSRKPFEDDLEYLARVWKIHPYQVQSIIDQICSSKYGRINNAEFRPEEIDEESEPEEIPEEIRTARHGRPPLVLWTQFAWHKYPISFVGLSGSEQGLIFLCGGMILAEYCSLHRGALLVLDLGTNFDDSLLSEYATRLQNSDFRFQTILVCPSVRPKIDWTGWTIARLSAGRFDQTMIIDEQPANDRVESKT